MVLKIDTTLCPRRTVEVLSAVIAEHQYEERKDGFLGVPYTEYNIKDIGGKDFGERFGSAFVKCHTTKTMTVLNIWGQ